MTGIIHLPTAIPNRCSPTQHRSRVEKVRREGTDVAGGDFHHVAGNQTRRGQRIAFLAGVLVLPVLINGRGHFHQPGPVFCIFQQVSSREKFDAIRRRIAQRFEQPGMNQRGDVMRLAVQHPARLLRSEAEQQLT